MKFRVTKRHALFGLVGLLGLLFILVELYLLSPGFRVICVAGGERVHAWGWLVNRLDDDDQDVRAAASEALIRGGPSAVPALIHGLQSSSAPHRSLVAFTLSRIDPPATEALPALKMRMQTDDDEPVRTATAKALGLIGQDSPEVLADLMKLLETGDEPSRVSAAEAFGAMREKAKPAIPLLSRALKDEKSAVRAEAAEALGAIGLSAKSAIPALTEALRDKDGKVREEAAEAIQKIVIRLGDDDAELRDTAKAALEKVRSEKTPPNQDKKP